MFFVEHLKAITRTLQRQCVEDAQVAKEILNDMAVIGNELEHLLSSSHLNKEYFNTRQRKTTHLGRRSSG